MLSFGRDGGATARRSSLRVTGSTRWRARRAALLALDPNVLYLQSTPMTEPLLIGLLVASVADVEGWSTRRPRDRTASASTVARGGVLDALRGVADRRAVLTLAALAGLPAPARAVLRDDRRLAALAGLPSPCSSCSAARRSAPGLSSVGSSCPRTHAQRSRLALEQWAVRRLAGPLAWAARLVAAVAGRRRLAPRARRCAWSLLAPAAAAALPVVRLLRGSPRTACATWSRSSLRWVFWLGRWSACCAALARPVLGATVVLVVLVARAAAVRRATRRWCSRRSGICRTAAPARPSRRAHGRWDGRRSWPAWARSRTTCRNCRTPDSASATSCTKATATSGSSALKTPARHAAWILIEERAEGGDMLASARASDPRFLAGYRPRRGRGGVALYRMRNWRGPWRLPLVGEPHVRFRILNTLGREPAQIDLASEDELSPVDRQVAGRVLIAHLAPDAQGSSTMPRSPPRITGPDGGAVLDEALAEDRAIARVDELARFAVAPVEERDAAAEVRLEPRRAEREEPDGRGDRRDAELEILFDLGAVRPFVRFS